MNDSNEDASGIIGGLFLLGLAFLASKSNSNNNKEQHTKESIKSFQIEEIVNDAYYIDTEDFSENMIEIVTMLVYEFTPSICKKTKRECLINYLKPRITHINSSIRHIGDLYKQEMHIHGDIELIKMVNCLIDDCIYTTEKIVGIMNIPTFFGNFNKYVKVTNFFKRNTLDLVNKSIMYKSIKRATYAYFNAIYVENYATKDAHSLMKDVYKNTYIEMLSL